MTNTMTYNRAFQTASEIFLTDPVPYNFLALSPKAQNEWLADHVWEPLENLYPSDLYNLIDSAAQAILNSANQAQAQAPATLRCGTKVSRDEYLRLHGQEEAINQALNSFYKQLHEVCELIEEVESTAEFKEWKL